MLVTVQEPALVTHGFGDACHNLPMPALSERSIHLSLSKIDMTNPASSDTPTLIQLHSSSTENAGDVSTAEQTTLAVPHAFETEGQWVIVLAKFGAAGWGATFEEAADNFVSALRTHIDRGRSGNRTPDATRWSGSCTPTRRRRSSAGSPKQLSGSSDTEHRRRTHLNDMAFLAYRTG